ncbi:hypothetical protein Ae406Ps2_1589 [Pseudonocardia sp. Ae406_Ps2]|nr:hypothetical protein Ae406Ps2_1589 [Pseudonocardia sp. Ae406_Ps2]OLM06608.1 hypothetical protein Ae331Ps2_4318c [Pseudonocardia sp. Ae331_Ps2]OLM13362.1 hypothetical protein Ae505Ps2_3490c [Pseudonocardia sp. Ae505_Ps2]OLM23162.1 hypothetical protein Ae706Ps2_1595 [Pseudonocardia sp. Ae706_Ps2]
MFAEIATADPPRGPRTVMGRAVVLGASIAGMLAARVLADHAEEVLLVDPDGDPTGPEPRPGVPQGGQVHALLPAGQVQLERWFPGITATAIREGAVPPDPATVELWVNGRLRPLPATPQDEPTLVTTRPFLENLVRRATTAVPGIRVVAGRAEGLVFDGARVSGARVRVGDEVVTEPADLVVDATGRSSRLAEWLGQGGHPRPTWQRMPIRLNYASALFERDPAISDAGVVIATSDADDGRVARQAGIQAVENDRWIVLVAGYGDDRPTRDPADFRERCSRDFPAAFGDIATGARMIGDVVTYHQADSRRRDTASLRQLPAGIIPIGDAIASFNPVYGQGMTSAALHASCLSAYLRSAPSLAEPARGYLDDVQVVVDAAWSISTLADLRLPHVDGPYPRGYPVASWFGRRLQAASFTDPELNRRLSAVTMMHEHPSVLARPGTVARVLRGGRGRPVG